jgi:hypothetical protein
MGKFSKGIFGNFSGKIGQVVGSSWRGTDYLKSLPRINKNRQPSPAQLEQQAKFAMVTAFLGPIREVLNIGFRNAPSAATTYNHALADNIKFAITGVFPSLALDYSLLQLSRGVMPGGTNSTVTALPGGALQFTWGDNTGKGKALATDLVVALVYSPELNDSEYSIGAATRADQSLTFVLPADFSGKVVETWILWAASNGKEVTATNYTGAVTVIS